jgi:hypothetical protein
MAVALKCVGPVSYGLPEWLNGAVSKTVRGLRVLRGFESHPLRFVERNPCMQWDFAYSGSDRGRMSLLARRVSAWEDLRIEVDEYREPSTSRQGQERTGTECPCGGGATLTGQTAAKAFEPWL